MRQRQIGGAVRGLEARGIAVEGQGRFRRHAPQQLQLVGGERRAQRRHRMGEAGPHQRDHIHIAFGDDDVAGLDGGGRARWRNCKVARPSKTARSRPC